jgi:hypothetical protein
MITFLLFKKDIKPEEHNHVEERWIAEHKELQVNNKILFW